MAAALARIGLTVPDAVCILLTRVAAEGGLPAGLATDPDSYDAWFRARVRERCRTHDVDFIALEPRSRPGAPAGNRGEAPPASLHPKLYRRGRVTGTREMDVRPNYNVYTERPEAVSILRVVHAAQQWP